MNKLRISDPGALTGAIFFFVGALLGGVASVGTTSGFRKTWGFVLVLPAILWGLYAVGTLLSLLSDPERSMEYVVNLIGVSIPVAIAGYIAWRWLPEDKPHGA